MAHRNSAVLASCRLISQSPLFNVCQCLHCDILIFSRFQLWLVGSGMANVKEAWKIFRGLLPKPKLRSTCFSTFEIILPWENELRETTQDGRLHPKLKISLLLCWFGHSPTLVSTPGWEFKQRYYCTNTNIRMWRSTKS